MSRKNLLASQKYTPNNRVRLVRSGSEYFDALLLMIRNAKSNIHIQTYIYQDDNTGRLIADALKEAAARKIEVYLLVDGYASQAMSAAFLLELKQAGVHFRFFEPIFRSKYFYFGRRMHSKMVVVDGRIAMVGGINIADRYNDLPDLPAWLDFALEVEGEIARHLCVLAWKTWNGFPLRMEITPCEKEVVSFAIPVNERSEVRMDRNDWVRRKNEISRMYVEMFRNAHEQVTILCSYFLPGKIIRRQMVQAIQRGVSVRVIAAGISDVKLAKYAERWLYDWLLRNRIELYEYQKTILHGKIATSDDEWMTAGSYNINNISAYASIELNLDVRNRPFAVQTREMLDRIIREDCIRITSEYHLKTKNVIKQFVRWLSYQFIRTIFYLFTFYFRHQR